MFYHFKSRLLTCCCRPAPHGSATLPHPVSVLRVRRRAVVSAVPALWWYGSRGAFQYRQLCTSHLHDRTHHRTHGKSTVVKTHLDRVVVCSPHLPCLSFFTLSLQPGDFVHTLGDAHIYVNHIEPLKVQVGYLKTAFCLPARCLISYLTHVSEFAAAEGDPALPQAEDPEESGEHRWFPCRGLWDLRLQPSSLH